MKYRGISWNLFAPMIRKSISARFSPQLADKAIRNGKLICRHLTEAGDDLGPGNPMSMNAYFAYVFAAALLGTDGKSDD
ncbi:MAG: hypothetical protein ACI4WR_08085 [Bulleidia sp.]